MSSSLIIWYEWATGCIFIYQPKCFKSWAYTNKVTTKSHVRLYVDMKLQVSKIARSMVGS